MKKVSVIWCGNYIIPLFYRKIILIFDKKFFNKL